MPGSSMAARPAAARSCSNARRGWSASAATVESGYATAPYVAAQGTALGRRGRAHISQEDDGTVWVGGGTVTCVTGQVELPA